MSQHFFFNTVAFWKLLLLLSLTPNIFSLKMFRTCWVLNVVSPTEINVFWSPTHTHLQQLSEPPALPKYQHKIKNTLHALCNANRNLVLYLDNLSMQSNTRKEGREACVLYCTGMSSTKIRRVGNNKVNRTVPTSPIKQKRVTERILQEKTAFKKRPGHPAWTNVLTEHQVAALQSWATYAQQWDSQETITNLVEYRRKGTGA